MAAWPTVLSLLMPPLALAATGLIVWRRWYSLRAAPARPVVFEPPIALTVALLLFVSGALGVHVARLVAGPDLVSPDGTVTRVSHALLSLGQYAVQGVVVLGCVVVAARAAIPDDRRPSRARAGLVGAAAVLLLWPVVTVVAWLMAALAERMTGDAPDPIAHETLRMLVAGPVDRWFVVIAVLVTVAAPIVEEWLYRGLIQSSLRGAGLGPWPAVLAASGIFAVMHVGAVPGHAMVVLFFLSLGFGWAFERTGRLSAPIVMHAIFNAGNLALSRLGE